MSTPCTPGCRSVLRFVLALTCSTSCVATKVAARVVLPERRSLAFGLCSAAGSIGTFLAAPLAQEIIQTQGWQMAIFAFIALAAVMLPAAFMGGRADSVPIEALQHTGETIDRKSTSLNSSH